MRNKFVIVFINVGGNKCDEWMNELMLKYHIKIIVNECIIQ